MNLSPGYLFGMALQSVAEPRVVAADVLALRLSRAVLWQGFALFVVLSTALGVLGAILFPPDPEFLGPLLSDPILLGILEASSLVLTVFAIYWVGRAMGGTGRFDQAILTVIWLQFITLMLQVLMLLLALIAPLLAVLVQVLTVGISFWVLSHFIAVMHGFRSVGMVFVMILVTMMGALFGLSVILAMIGVGAAAAGGF